MLRPQLFHTSLFSSPISSPPRTTAISSHSQQAFPMAHHHSPSPSGRRLSELLGEQQEPFYLDLYLLEKGCCSPSFLDAAACGGGGSCSTCWPRAQSSGRRLLMRRPPPARSKKKPPRRSGVLRLLLSKFLAGATAAPAPARKKKKRQQTAAIEWRRADVVEEKQSTPGPSMNAVECHHTEVVVDEEPGEEEDEEESKKQLSPVSVLEQRLFEHSPPPHAQRAMVLFSELLEAAYAPSTLLHLLANAKQYSSSKSRDDGRRGSNSTPPPPTTRRGKRRKKKKNGSRQHVRREDDDETPFERDLARATAVVASEMVVGAGGAARVRMQDVAAEREEVGVDVAAAVMDALMEEAAAELMAMGR